MASANLTHLLFFGAAGFFFGTFKPASLASEIPMAMACLRSLTLSPELLLSLPSLNSFITLPTFFSAVVEYFFSMIAIGLIKMGNKTHAIVISSLKRRDRGNYSATGEI